MVFDKVYLIKSISAVTNYNSSSCFNTLYLSIVRYTLTSQMVDNYKVEVDLKLLCHHSTYIKQDQMYLIKRIVYYHTMVMDRKMDL